MASIIQLRRDTAANWTSVNPVLAQGELGVETDTSKIKMGDGLSTWAALTYLVDVGSYLTATSTNTLTNKTITAAVLDGGYSEEVFTLGTTGSLALDPANGSIQTCTLTGDPTFTDSLSTGESIVLELANGASYIVTFPTITWVSSGGNVAPTLTALDTLVFWKISTTLYGAWVGSGV